MGSVAELVAAVTEDGTFDVTEAQVLRWLNERHRKMCARTQCFRKTLTVGGGVVPGQSVYALPAGVIEILQVTVGGVVYGNARHSDYAEGERGWLWLGGEGGIAGREDSASGEAQVRLFPTPPASGGGSPAAGAAISLYAVVEPPPLVVGDDSTIKVPDEYLEALAAGAIATGLLRVESRPDLAQPHEQIFSAACLELQRATNRRFRGAGPARIRIVGLNA